MEEIIISVSQRTLIAGTPLLLGTIGEVICERSGILNLGVQGMMFVGAMVGFWVGADVNPWLGLLLFLLFAVSLGGIILASDFVIVSATTIARSFSIPESVIALTLVALGTLAAWGEGKQRWRVVLDRLDRLGREQATLGRLFAGVVRSSQHVAVLVDLQDGIEVLEIDGVGLDTLHDIVLPPVPALWPPGDGFWPDSPAPTPGGGGVGDAGDDTGFRRQERALAWPLTRLIGVIGCSLIITGTAACRTFDPTPIEQVPFRERAQTQIRNGIRVKVSPGRRLTR